MGKRVIQRGMCSGMCETCHCATPLLVQRDRDLMNRRKRACWKISLSCNAVAMLLFVRSLNLFLSFFFFWLTKVAFFAHKYVNVALKGRGTTVTIQKKKNNRSFVSSKRVHLVSSFTPSFSYIVKRNDTLSLSLIFGTDDVSHREQCDRGVTYFVTVVLDYDK